VPDWGRIADRSGEGIVNTRTDAIRTFYSSGMDALVIGPYLVEK
jgi:predicted NodU family carbamoyl transferase